MVKTPYTKEENLKKARQNLIWIIGMMEDSDIKHKKELAKQDIFIDGEFGYVFHLKKVLELLEE
jgi:hypothetical protein